MTGPYARWVTRRILRVPCDAVRTRSDPSVLIDVLRAAAGSVDVAYLHMCTGLHDPDAFDALCGFLTSGVWAVNLGELSFTSAQLAALLQTIRASDVTHMFYECASLPTGFKDALREAIRSNRKKHDRWRLQEGDEASNYCVRHCTQMWFDPMEHTVNGGLRRSFRDDGERT